MSDGINLDPVEAPEHPAEQQQPQIVQPAQEQEPGFYRTRLVDLTQSEAVLNGEFFEGNYKIVRMEVINYPINEDGDTHPMLFVIGHYVDPRAIEQMQAMQQQAAQQASQQRRGNIQVPSQIATPGGGIVH